MNMYFAALVLPPGIDSKILRFKEMMRERYGCLVGLKSPAHITLVAPFWMDPGKETGLVSDVGNLDNRAPFPLRTHHFDCFRPRTIFVALHPNEELSRLKNEVDGLFCNNLNYAIKAGDRPFHPHITIATRDLRKKDFAEAWAYFRDKEMEEEWMASGISVLRHNKKNWDVIHTSQFRL